MATLKGILCLVPYLVASVVGEQLTLKRYPDKAMSGITPVHTSTASKPLTCLAQCLRRADCVAAAVAVYGSSCSLYATSVTDPATQLQDQPGTVVYSQVAMAPEVDVISVTLDDSPEKNLGKPNFFPQLAATRGGRVVKWQVRCGSAGTVYLAMMRPMGSLTSLKLIGRHLITVTADMVNQVVDFDVPEGEDFAVEAGDFAGFHYDGSGQARVQLVTEASRPDLHLETSYGVTIDGATDVGTTVTATASNLRSAVMAVHIAV